MEIVIHVATLAVAIVLVVLISTLGTTLDRHRQEQQEELRAGLRALGEKVDDALRTLAELDYRLLNPAEKIERRFDNARALTLLDVQKMRPGQTLRLMRRAFHPPSEVPSFDEFEFKHDDLGAPTDRPASTFHAGEIVQTTKRCTPVHGFVRWDDTQEWMPFDFLAAADESEKSGDTIRRLLG